MGFATSPTPDLTGDGLDDVVGGSGYSVNRVRAIEGSTGDTLWMRSTVGPVETVSYIASIDGDAWPEILAGTREGEIICYAGGGGTAGIADGTGSAEDRNTRVSTTIWNCPNPCRPETDILFRLRSETETKVAIYDIHGRLVKVLSEGLLPAGEHSTHWDGRDRTGAPVAAGIYFADLQTGKEVLSRKIILMR
jgi:hypothetical protein